MRSVSMPDPFRCPCGWLRVNEQERPRALRAERPTALSKDPPAGVRYL